MTKLKKTAVDKEQKLLELIAHTQKKLNKIRTKQITAIAELVRKYDIHRFPLETIEAEFKKLAAHLNTAAPKP